ncbi:EDSAP-1 family PEP-CTERM protein [Alteromonas gracilis]|uniref:EDSAP-1 family PEP-CTERM protein n=1 Tax=Alteromonas gracilis TaxID=1479524 RepID=UPI0037363E59
MKLATTIKYAAIAGALVTASNATAGVSATAYLELNDLVVEIDTNGDLIPDPVNPLDFISILPGGTRSTSTFVDNNGASDSDLDSQPSATADSDADLLCLGASCGVLGLTNNGQSVDGGNLVASDAFYYSVADAQVTGSAIGAGATGFTYADAGIPAGNDESAGANSNIANDILTTFTLGMLTDINVRFSALMDYLVDAFISPDIAADGTRGATSTAKATFGIELVSFDTGDTVDIDGDSGVTFNDIAIDQPGLGNLIVRSGNDVDFTSGWANVTAGTYQLTITQSSTVQTTLVPAPATLAMAAFGLLGLGLTARRRKQK